MVARTRLTDLHDGAVGLQLLAGTAREVEDIHDRAAQLIAMFDPATAEGEDLDDYAAVLSAYSFPPRRAAVKATGLVQFYRTAGAGATPVPIGSVVAASFPGVADVSFETTAVGTIPAGAPPQQVSIAVRALVAGTASNVGAGTINKRVTPITGVDVVGNTLAIIGGEDKESDASLRERARLFILSLAVCTPSSLEALALTIGVAEHADGVQGAAIPYLTSSTPTVRRCVYSRLVEDPAFPCVSTLYVDDGSGFAGIPTGQLYGSVVNAVLVAAATGGEVRIRFPFWPITPAAPFILRKNTVPLTEGLHYRVDRSNGRIVLTSALVAGGLVDASGTFHCDLARAVQYAVEGDPADRKNWPGWRAASSVVFVRYATAQLVTVIGTVATDPNYDHATIAATTAPAAVQSYINGLGIGVDVVWAELVAAIMGVEGVTDCSVSTPAANIPVADDHRAVVLSIALT